MEELEIIARLHQIFSAKAQERPDVELLVEIGDDAAFFRTISASGDADSSGIAIATDLLTEGTHFKREWSDLYSIGRKAAAANLADIYAMGVPARFLLVAVAFRPEDGSEILNLARGIADECSLVGARVIGGDIARGSSLTISITALGVGAGVVTRSGARPGDAIFVSAFPDSLPGRSLLGLEQLRRGLSHDQASIDIHRAPRIDYETFISFSKAASSLCDISDGIMIDSTSLARASGVTIDIESSAIVAHPHFAAIALTAEKMALDPLEVVLTSGEEHGPLFTASAHQEIEGAWRIGVVRDQMDSLLLIDGQPTEAAGFTHF